MFDGRTLLYFFFWKLAPFKVYLGQGEDFKLTQTELAQFKKCNIPTTRQSRKQLNEAMLIM